MKEGSLRIGSILGWFFAGLASLILASGVANLLAEGNQVVNAVILVVVSLVAQVAVARWLSAASSPWAWKRPLIQAFHVPLVIVIVVPAASIDASLLVVMVIFYAIWTCTAAFGHHLAWLNRQRLK